MSARLSHLITHGNLPEELGQHRSDDYPRCCDHLDGRWCSAVKWTVDPRPVPRLHLSHVRNWEEGGDCNADHTISGTNPLRFDTTSSPDWYAGGKTPPLPEP